MSITRHARRSRGAARWSVLALAVGTAALGGADTASADEHYSGQTTIGPRFALIGTGQIDDPLEDVLEHATVLGSTTMTESEAAEPVEPAEAADPADTSEPAA
ncbi:hypothetical protein [Streptomyces sp. RFCAC02]|uniref:hypothetical protein n=1 Tax=Streptomyces sp. RFCAC02 TaxID=2499143 RepID=UPI0010224EEB